MKNSIPLIRIKDAWLLRDNASVHLNELWGDGEPLRSDEEYEEIVKSYKEAWKPYEQKILHGMCELLDLEFKQNIIDVFIAPWFHAFSDPLVIGVTFKPDRFIDILTHELLHRLLTDNTAVPSNHLLRNDWKNLFGEEHSFVTLIHIPVHAMLKAIMLDTLQEPTRLKRDIAIQKKGGHTAYIDAWEYVQNHDYRQIIEDLKDQYKKLQSDISLTKHK